MTFSQRIAEFTWERSDVMRACDGNKAATEILEYFLYLFRCRAKESKEDDINSEVYGFRYTVSYLTKRTHFAERTVRRGIKLLKEKGMLKVSQPMGYNRRCEYRINLEKVQAWFYEKLDLFPVDTPEPLDCDRPCGQSGHMEAANLATCMRPTWPHGSGQSGHLLIVTEVTKEEVVTGESELIQVMREKTGLATEQCELILERNPDKSLVLAAIDCWLERASRIKTKDGENPVGFLRGCINDPRAFGIQGTTGGYHYQLPPKKRDQTEVARTREAINSIREQRKQGYDDRYIASALGVRYKSDVLAEAFKQAGNE